MTLYFVGDLKSDVEVTKNGSKYMYFTAKTTGCKYRMNKVTKVIEIAPYWRKERRMFLVED